MRRLSPLLILALAACSEPGGNPLGGGGGPPSGGDDDDDAPDAAPAPDAPHVDAILGKLCQVETLLNPTSCPLDATFTGVVVAHLESGEATLAEADGDFQLPSDLTGADIATLRLAPNDAVYRRSVVPIFLRSDGSAGPIPLPVMEELSWINLTSAIGSPDQPGDAAIVVYAIDGTTTVEGATVSSAIDGEVYYSNGAALEWTQSTDGTDVFGTILITALTPSTPTRTFTVKQGDKTATVTDLPVESEGVTFVTVVLN